MNASITPDLSLLQILQQQTPTLKPLAMQWSTFNGLLEGVFKSLGEHRLKATIWAKLPANSPGELALETYYQTGLADRVYNCHLAKHQNTSTSAIKIELENTAIASNFVPLVLETNAHLKREYFVLVLSPQLSLLLLAQEIATQSPSEEGADQGNLLPLKGLYSFSPDLIELLLTRIKQSLSITDSTPEDLLSESVLAFPLPKSLEVSLLSDLFQHQIQQLIANTSSPPILASSEPFLSSGVTFNNEFLMQLTRELSLPLTNIKTALWLLDSMQHKREQRQRYISLLQRECDRQSLLLSSLQELVELNQSNDENDSIAVHLEDLVPGVVSIYQPIAEEKGISLGYTVPAGFPAVACSSAWLKLILRHLLHNSLKFTPANGRVYVQTDLKQDSVELIVSDTGVGIETKDIPHLFDPFFRGRNLPAQETEGSGLGLMVVKQLVDRCHGTITVNSKINKGTVIRVMIPTANL